ncbi:MAG TPA: glycosyltransferase family 25 protein [Rickettsia endosymbiont of Pyrocoelia pectoralis]|nr:glycosyltransferase family 25 protein [Rickettsia endosymbiont of Pyrocoelia pectoralis]
MQTVIQKKYFLLLFPVIACLLLFYKFQPTDIILFSKTNQIKTIPIDEKNIRVFVVNLDRSTDRYNNISKQFDKNNLSHERFSAVNGYTLEVLDQKGKIFTGLELKNDPLLLSFDKSYIVQCPSENINYYNNRKKQHYTLTAGELGCYCSHREIWLKMVRENIPYTLIVEDDAILDNNFQKQYLKLLRHLPAQWDLVYLSLIYFKDDIFQNVDNNHYLKKIIKKGFNTTTSYLVSLEGAKKLLKYSIDFNLPIDNMMEQIIIRHKLQAYISAPFLIKADDNFEGSTISEMGRTR